MLIAILSKRFRSLSVKTYVPLTPAKQIFWCFFYTIKLTRLFIYKVIKSVYKVDFKISFRVTVVGKKNIKE